MTRLCLLALPLLFALACKPADRAGLPDPGPNPATLTFESDPPGATVVVDGVEVGAAPQTVKLRPGPHRVKARKSGYFGQEQAISVSGGQTHTVTLTLVASH